MRCIITVHTGVSKRSWQTEIVQDHLEEAEETFEVQLVSPVGAVIGGISKARLTIGDSGTGDKTNKCSNVFLPRDGMC